MYGISLIMGEKHGLKITQRLFLFLFEWFHFQRQFNTGGRQLKQGIGT